MRPFTAAVVLSLLLLGASAEGNRTSAKVHPTNKAVDSWCSGNHRTCTEVSKDDGKFFLILQTERRGLDHYKLCVTSPRGKQRCHKYPVNLQTKDSYASVVPFKDEYPHRVKGTYGVSWRTNGNRLGFVLHFNFR